MSTVCQLIRIVYINCYSLVETDWLISTQPAFSLSKNSICHQFNLQTWQSYQIIRRFTLCSVQLKIHYWLQFRFLFWLSVKWLFFMSSGRTSGIRCLVYPLCIWQSILPCIIRALRFLVDAVNLELHFNSENLKGSLIRPRTKGRAK
mgnify:CR=1 FL=1